MGIIQERGVQELNAGEDNPQLEPVCHGNDDPQKCSGTEIRNGSKEAFPYRTHFTEPIEVLNQLNTKQQIECKIKYALIEVRAVHY